MAETKVGLNTGFTSGPDGLHKISRIALETNTGGLADDSGVLKRKVLEPDEFPRVSLNIVSPHDPEDADIDKANVNKAGSQRSRQGHAKRPNPQKADPSLTE